MSQWFPTATTTAPTSSSSSSNNNSSPRQILTTAVGSQMAVTPLNLFCLCGNTNQGPWQVRNKVRNQSLKHHSSFQRLRIYIVHKIDRFENTYYTKPFSFWIKKLFLLFYSDVHTLLSYAIFKIKWFIRTGNQLEFTSLQVIRAELYTPYTPTAQLQPQVAATTHCQP